MTLSFFVGVEYVFTAPDGKPSCPAFRMSPIEVGIGTEVGIGAESNEWPSWE